MESSTTQPAWLAQSAQSASQPDRTPRHQLTASSTARTTLSCAP